MTTGPGVVRGVPEDVEDQGPSVHVGHRPQLHVVQNAVVQVLNGIFAG